MKPQKIRITQAGWANFTDTMCGVEFVDGLSVYPVPHNLILTLGSLFSIEGVDEQEQVGMGAHVKASRTTKAKVVPALADSTPESVGISTDAVAPVKKFTREELETIADEHGIAGLREIADGFKVKGRGIMELIAEITKAQG